MLNNIQLLLQKNRLDKLNELIEKIKNQINIILDMRIGDRTVKDSLSQVDSRASAIPIAAVITVFLFLVMQALVSSNEFD